MFVPSQTSIPFYVTWQPLPFWISTCHTNARTSLSDIHFLPTSMRKRRFPQVVQKVGSCGKAYEIASVCGSNSDNVLSQFQEFSRATHWERIWVWNRGSHLGAILSLRGLSPFLESFLVVTPGVQGYYWTLEGRGQGCCKHPAMHICTAQTCLAPNVNNVEVEKSWLRVCSAEENCPRVNSISMAHYSTTCSNFLKLSRVINSYLQNETKLPHRAWHSVTLRIVTLIISKAGSEATGHRLQ